MTEPTWVDSEDAARRLGVKPSTLYAYVSRGLLRSERAPDGRRSLFLLDEVERLAARGRGGRQTEMPSATVATSVTRIDSSGPRYRGELATKLATTRAFEEVAALLWQVEDGPWVAVRLPEPPELAPHDLLRWVVVMSAAADPLAAEASPAAMVVAARSLMATMAAVVGAGGVAAGGSTQIRPRRPRAASRVPVLALGDGRVVPESLAARVTSGLSSLPGSDGLVAAVNAALVLLADHELATSTMAVRLAASTRAGLYDCALAGLGALGGALHGSVSGLVTRMLADAERSGADQALADALRWRGAVPGFGMALYPEGDPRAAALLPFVRALEPSTRLDVLEALTETCRQRGYPLPNIDFAVGALVFVAGMAEDAGEVVFSIARLAGWTAHAVEELAEDPLRFRVRAVYARRS